jgi:hypothetical protein
MRQVEAQLVEGPDAALTTHLLHVSGGALMSLKAIKEAFSLARARKGFGDTEEEMLADDAAMKEIAALEKAAEALGVSGWLTVIQEECGITKAEREAIAVLKTIAKEAE